MSEHNWGLGDMEQVIKQLCINKVEEFKLYGYEHVTSREVWMCVSEGYKGTLPPLYQLANDILSLKPTKFMNWMTVKAYKGIDLD